MYHRLYQINRGAFMENKILELLLDMQKDMKDVKLNTKELNSRTDRLEAKIN